MVVQYCCQHCALKDSLGWSSGPMISNLQLQTIIRGITGTHTTLLSITKCMTELVAASRVATEKLFDWWQLGAHQSGTSATV